MAFTLERVDGKVVGVTSERGFHRKGDDNPHWQEFVELNAKQPTPLDLSDKDQEPPPIDLEQKEVRTLLKKHADDLTLPEISKIVKRLARGF